MLCKVDIVRLHKQSVVGSRTHRKGIKAHRGVNEVQQKDVRFGKLLPRLKKRKSAHEDRSYDGFKM